MSGYCAGSFLALEPWPAWPALSMLMMANGMLIGCWPELKCTIRESGKALLMSMLLLVALMGLASLHAKLRPPPMPQTDPARLHNAV